MFKDVPEEDIEQGKWPILSWPCNPGDCVVFHGKTLHGSYGNESKNNWRRVLSTRWLGQDTRMTSRPWEVSPPMNPDINIGVHPKTFNEFPTIWKS